MKRLLLLFVFILPVFISAQETQRRQGWLEISMVGHNINLTFFNSSTFSTVNSFFTDIPENDEERDEIRDFFTWLMNGNEGEVVENIIHYLDGYWGFTRNNRVITHQIMSIDRNERRGTIRLTIWETW
ncbi:MAG: hypothetical protein FWE37_06805 [Spirochaetaceae bacterium]|nr:hypothetical protein [Spirochaetaceae bacterium]